MRKILIIAFAALLLAACGDDIKAAIKSEVTESNAEVAEKETPNTLEVAKEVADKWLVNVSDLQYVEGINVISVAVDVNYSESIAIDKVNADTANFLRALAKENLDEPVQIRFNNVGTKIMQAKFDGTGDYEAAEIPEVATEYWTK